MPQAGQLPSTSAPQPARRTSIASRIAGGSAWVLAGRLMFGLSVVLQNVVFARVLAPQELGAFLLAQSLILPAAIVAVFGLDLLAMRDLRDPRLVSNRVSPASFLKLAAVLVGATASVVTLALAAGLHGACAASAALDCGFVTALTPALWPLVFLSALQLLLAGMLRALGRIAEATFLAGVLATFALLCATSLAFALHVELGFRGALVLQALTLVGAAVLSIRSIVKVEHVRSGKRASMPEMARIGPGLMTTQLLALLVSQSDVWIIGLGAAPEAVAQYGVAARLAQLVSMPHLVLVGVLSPLIAAHLAERQRQELERVVRATVAAAVLPSLVLGLAFATFGRDALVILFGEFYGAASVSLALLAAGNVVNVACGPCSLMLIMSGHQRALNALTALNCVLCLGAGALALAWFGAVGVAAVYAVCLSLQGIAGATLAAKLAGVRTHAGSLILARAVRSALRSRHGSR